MGPATAVEAMADGKKAAAAIDRYLTGQDRFAMLFAKFEYENKTPDNVSAKNKQTGRKLPVKYRVSNFEEVSLGLNAAQAKIESQRCMRCDVRQ